MVVCVVISAAAALIEVFWKLGIGWLLLLLLFFFVLCLLMLTLLLQAQQIERVDQLVL